MKITQKKLDDGRLQLECIADANEVNRALNEAKLAFAQQMGLRPNKDRDIDAAAEAQMGIKDLDSVVENQALEFLAPYALDQRNIMPAYPPQPMGSSLFKRDKPYSFRLFVMPKPDYELSSYAPVEFTAQEFVFDESEVEQQLIRMTEMYKEYVTAEAHPVEKGDSVLISIEASQNGVRMEGLCTDGRTYVTGEGYMPDGFDEQIIGMSPGETKSFTFEGPGFDDDGNDTMETVECTVTVIELQKETAGEIDDAWVKKNLPVYNNAEELRRDIRNGAERRQRAEYDARLANLAVYELTKRFQGKIADPIYESCQKNLLADMRKQVQEQHMTWDQFVESNGGEQQFNMLVMMQVRQTLLQGFCLDAVFRHEGLVLNEDDVMDACRKFNPQRPTAVRKELEASGKNFVLREAAERLKASKWLVEHAKITYRKEEE